jgi:ketosteroid isomerase-like protein
VTLPSEPRGDMAVHARPPSAEALATLRESYDAWNRGDVDAILAGMHPEVEFELSEILPGMPSLLRGHAGIRRMFDEWYVEPWKGPLAMEIEHVYMLGNHRALVLLRFRGEGSGSGAHVEQPYAHLIEAKDGLTYRIRGFGSWDEALAAAGIT